jgi:hypothetical protein
MISQVFILNEGAKKQPQFRFRPAIQGFSRHILSRYSGRGIPVPPCLFCLSAVMAMHIILKFKHNEIKIVQKQQRRKKQPLGCIRRLSGKYLLPGSQRITRYKNNRFRV